MPQAFDILGIGINEHKMNTTGRTEWTGITRDAKAEFDAPAYLAYLMAHEVRIQGFRFVEMLQSNGVNNQQFWKSKVFFPDTNMTKDAQKRQISSLLDKITQQIPGWDKDKRTGLFRKTAASLANGAGADSDRVNRQLGWKQDTQSRSYAVADLGAYIDVQAMQAGFEKNNWRLHQHLGRAAVAIDESWYDVLVPGLTTTSDLSLRKQEVLQAHKKLVEAFWQALPVHNLKYGKEFVAGLPDVEEVMQTVEYASFSNRVLQAECDSMEKLQMMQEVPYLAKWQQAQYARQECEQVAHHSDQSKLWETRQQSQIMSAEAAEIVNQEPPTKRQKIASDAADKEHQLQVELEQLRAHRRYKGLQLQIDQEKRAILELDQQQQDVRSRHMMCNSAQGVSVLTQVISASTVSQDVQVNNTPFIPELKNEALHIGSSAVEDVRVPAAQPSKVVRTLNPDMFKSQTIHGRYQEWVGGGQYASIKSYVNRSKRGWELPKEKGTQHTGAASDNLRRNVHLPEAVEHLVMQGLSEEAAVALVSQVVLDFELTTIATQSEAFAELYRLEKAARAGDAAQVAKKETAKLSKTGRTVKEFKMAFDQAKNDAFTWGAFLQQALLT